jgi:uncharacterized protein
MKIFLDTSSIFKLYHQEIGTVELENVFNRMNITHIFLSEITKIEFTSTIWKKVRTKEISVEQAEITLALFENDFKKYNFISTNSLIIEQARILVAKYGIQGLRTLDGIQLSTCVFLKNKVDVFFSADKLLSVLIEKEGLKTTI